MKFAKLGDVLGFLLLTFISEDGAGGVMKISVTSFVIGGGGGRFSKKFATEYICFGVDGTTSTIGGIMVGVGGDEGGNGVIGV